MVMIFILFFLTELQMIYFICILYLVLHHIFTQRDYTEVRTTQTLCVCMYVCMYGFVYVMHTLDI